MCWQAIKLLLIFLVIGKGAYAFDKSDFPVDLELGDYHHFDVDKNLRKKILRSGIIEVEVYNPNSESAPFFLVFEDDKSVDYWSRLNFKSTLAPGENLMSFELSRLIGERGSSRDQRKLNFKKLKKAYVVVDPDEEVAAAKDFVLKSVRLKTPHHVSLPAGIRFFDFAGEGMPHSDVKGVNVVTEKSKYTAARGYGFSHLELWQARDAGLKPDHLSSTLGVTKAVFRVDLPPGEYRYSLVWDELGYWDVPFWSSRMFYVNGVPARKENRSSVRDFMKDYLSLMEEPPAGSDVYDHYLKKIFKPVTGSFKVTKGHVDFQFEGDPTGASLNSLLIWKKELEKQSEDFMLGLHELGKGELERKHRFVGVKNPPFGKNLRAQVVPVFGRHAYGAKCGERESKEIVLARNGQGFFDLCLELDPTSPVTFKVGDFKSEKHRFPRKGVSLSKYLFRPKAIDLNAETFEVRVDQLEELEHPSFESNGYGIRYLNVNFSPDNTPPGTYRGEISFEQNKQKSSVTLEVTILGALQGNSVEGAGFIGLSPFPKTHFSKSDPENLSLRLAKNSLTKLQEAGLQYFTDVPSPNFVYQGSEKKRFVLESASLDAFLKNAKTDEVYLYDGNFPRDFMTGFQRNAGQSENSFWSNLASEFKRISSAYGKKEFIYLYSDEATGYRNAVDEDLRRFDEIKKTLPGLKLGGFGNLYTWEKGSKLYSKWDYGFYSDIPSERHFKLLKKTSQKVGLYNLCAQPTAYLGFCFGPMLYRFGRAGVNRYLEWHASAVHNYPGFDLDGREADVALFYPRLNGEVSVTKRYMEALWGVQYLRKLKLLEGALKARKAPGLQERKARLWLESINAPKLFPIKEYRNRNQKKFTKKWSDLDTHLKNILSK